MSSLQLMLVVGLLLMAGLGLSAIGGGVAYRRGRYDGDFWKLPLDDKLDHVHQNRRDWWWVSLWQLGGIFVMTAGLAGFTYLLSQEGEAVLAYVAFGGYLVVAMAWIFGLITQTTAIPVAATQRDEAGETPAWIHAAWSAGYLAEGAWVIGANLAYAAMGVAILLSGLLAAWAGWVAVGLGVAIPSVVFVTRYGFPELGKVVPFVIGIAALLETL